MGIAHCPEARRLFVEMTVEENLDMGSLRGEARKQRAKTKEMVFGLFPRLSERRRQPRGCFPAVNSRWWRSAGD